MSDVTPSLDWGSFDTSPFLKWERVGDTVTGVITAMSTGTDYNGNPCPIINLTTKDDGEKILSCGLSNLKAKVVELKPNIGDTLTVTFAEEKNTGKGNPLKVFTVEATPF